MCMCMHVYIHTWKLACIKVEYHGLCNILHDVHALCMCVFLWTRIRMHVVSLCMSLYHHSPYPAQPPRPALSVCFGLSVCLSVCPSIAKIRVRCSEILWERACRNAFMLCANNTHVQAFGLEPVFQVCCGAAAAMGKNDVTHRVPTKRQQSKCSKRAGQKASGF